jgi:hypothetical protein
MFPEPMKDVPLEQYRDALDEFGRAELAAADAAVGE